MYIHNLEDSTVRPLTTTGPIYVESTEDIFTQLSTTIRDTTLELHNITTERSTSVGTSANLPTKLSTFFAKEEIVTQSDPLSKSIKSEERHDDLNRGIFCVGLYISVRNHTHTHTHKLTN